MFVTYFRNTLSHFHYIFHYIFLKYISRSHFHDQFPVFFSFHVDGHGLQDYIFVFKNKTYCRQRGNITNMLKINSRGGCPPKLKKKKIYIYNAF